MRLRKAINYIREQCKVYIKKIKNTSASCSQDLIIQS